MSKDKTRYQDSSFHVRMCRWCRHKPKVPYYAIRGWWYGRKLPDYDADGFSKLTWKQHWSIANGIVGIDMIHYYTSEEVFASIREKLKNRDQT